MTETSIQDRFYPWLRNKSRQLICPNTKVFGWEADMVCITSAGYSYEYEIKTSRYDFEKDIHKSKHPDIREIYKSDKTLIEGNSNYRWASCPNYFYYLTGPEVNATAEEVPEYAGLILAEGNSFNKVKSAPRLHSDKLSDRQKEYIYRGLQKRFWSYRRGYKS